MTDNLRDRIAAVLEQHKTDPYSDWDCECGGTTGMKWRDHAADAVIAAHWGTQTAAATRKGDGQMSDDGVAAATCAVVVDVVADLIEPGGPGKAVRLLMRQEDALALWHKLGELFGCDTEC